MFSGLIETIGKIKSILPCREGKRFIIGSKFSNGDIAIGDSIAINGVCLTNERNTSEQFEVFVSNITLQNTRLGQYRTGQTVNVERALQIGARIGGHFVSGHVDTCLRISSIQQAGENKKVTFHLSPKDEMYVVEHGSICLDGVSLTISEKWKNTFSVNLIPHTQHHTILQNWLTNQWVNVEFDMLGKYVISTLKK